MTRAGWSGIEDPTRGQGVIGGPGRIGGEVASDIEDEIDRGPGGRAAIDRRQGASGSETQGHVVGPGVTLHKVDRGGGAGGGHGRSQSDHSGRGLVHDGQVASDGGGIRGYGDTGGPYSDDACHGEGPDGTGGELAGQSDVGVTGRCGPGVQNPGGARGVVCGGGGSDHDAGLAALDRASHRVGRGHGLRASRVEDDAEDVHP